MTNVEDHGNVEYEKEITLYKLLWQVNGPNALLDRMLLTNSAMARAFENKN